MLVMGDFNVHHRMTQSPWLDKRRGSSIVLGKQLYDGMMQNGLVPKVVHGVDTYHKVVNDKVTSKSIIDQVFVTKYTMYYMLCVRVSVYETWMATHAI